MTILFSLRIGLQEIMAREQELLLEEFTRFVGVLDGRSNLTIEQAKSWTMNELMEGIHPVSPAQPLFSACHRVSGLFSHSGVSHQFMSRTSVTWCADVYNRYCKLDC